MKKLLKLAAVAVIIYAAFWCGVVLREKEVINEDTVRPQVVTNLEANEPQIRLMILDWLDQVENFFRSL